MLLWYWLFKIVWDIDKWMWGKDKRGPNLSETVFLVSHPVLSDQRIESPWVDPRPIHQPPIGLDERGWMKFVVCIKPCPILGIQWPIIIIEQNALGNGETSGRCERTDGRNPYTMDESWWMKLTCTILPVCSWIQLGEIGRWWDFKTPLVNCDASLISVAHAIHLGST